MAQRACRTGRVHSIHALPAQPSNGAEQPDTTLEVVDDSAASEPIAVSTIEVVVVGIHGEDGTTRAFAANLPAVGQQPARSARPPSLDEH